MDKSAEQFFANLPTGPMGPEEYAALRSDVLPWLEALGRPVPEAGIPFMSVAEFAESEQKQ